MANRDSTTIEPASKIFPTGISNLVAAVPQAASGYPYRPQPPNVGPQAQFILTGHNIGHSHKPYATFEDASSDHRKGLEWLLFNLEKFDEPSRHMILAGTAVHFGMPFETVMGGML